ncbi:5'/3'-nucleotidase SurE [Almyronema epifaneia]|uniref:5'-nucleotidase n=1 Tax=Almyronema epifaneia S1 TaxID=2991925 RepID=A0ABW6IDE5_9CYAN
MTIVLTNDDGIEAPGIAALQAALGTRPTVWVAPDRPLSGCSHQINRGGAIAIEQRSPERYAIGGTPADCTRVALSHLCPEAEFVLSGINAGGNLGSDIYVSGTVAAVREAALLRVPGIAISHYIQRNRVIDWVAATRLAAKVLERLLSEKLPAGAFWNVNLPHLAENDPDPEIVFCPTCTQPLPTDYVVENHQFRYVGEYGQRSRDPGADVDTCFSGKISISQIRLW